MKEQVAAKDMKDFKVKHSYVYQIKRFTYKKQWSVYYKNEVLEHFPAKQDAINYIRAKILS